MKERAIELLKVMKISPLLYEELSGAMVSFAEAEIKRRVPIASSNSKPLDAVAQPGGRGKISF